MENPQAAWVDMMMSRLHDLEHSVDALKTENTRLRDVIDARAPAFAPGFNRRTDYFFYASVDWRLGIGEWKSRMASEFENFTICRSQIGEHVNPPPRHPLICLVGIVRGTEQHSSAGVSQLLRRCLGEARGEYGNVVDTRVGDVCEAVIAECEESAHRDEEECSDSECEDEGCSCSPDLDLLLSPDLAGEFIGQFRAFMASEHIVEHFHSVKGCAALRRIEEYLECEDMI